MKFDLQTAVSLIWIIALVLIIWLFVWCGIYSCNSTEGFEKSITIILSFIQGIAILFGGWLAHKKFIVERKIDEAIKVKAALKRFVDRHKYEAVRYRDHNNIIEYRAAMVKDYISLFNNVELSVIPKELRKKILETMFSTIAVNEEKVDEEWGELEEKIREINKVLDEIIFY